MTGLSDATLAWLDQPAAPPTRSLAADLVITVDGVPGPQGSKSFKGMRASKVSGKQVPVLVESSAKVKPWRAAVVEAAQEAVRAAHVGCLANRWPMFDGPVAVGMVFTLPAPQRMPKGRTCPSVKPDISKLIRSTEDALTDARVWADDALVVAYRDTAKTYPGGHADALAAPGAVIRIFRIGAQS